MKFKTSVLIRDKVWTFWYNVSLFSVTVQYTSYFKLAKNGRFSLTLYIYYNKTLYEMMYDLLNRGISGDQATCIRLVSYII